MGELSEFSIIKEYFSDFSNGQATVVGPGDDCAVLHLPPGKQLATSTDTIVQGVHFPVESCPGDIGHRAIAVAASDLAAIGARPLACSLSLSLPSLDRSWLRDFRSGLMSSSKSFSLPLVGGDLTSGSLAITVTVFGYLPVGEALLRSGAQAGDLVFVSGPLGDAAAGLAILQNQWDSEDADRENLIQRFLKPRPRIELGLELLEIANSAIDISDGLIADAGHIASESDLAIEIDASRIPLSPALSKLDTNKALRWALTGGDDYELCFTIPKDQAVPPGCTQIGITSVGQGVTCVGYDISSLDEGGYKHFS